jgi:hypothetical protein
MMLEFLNGIAMNRRRYRPHGLCQSALLRSPQACSTVLIRIGYASNKSLIYGTRGSAITNEKSTLTGATFACSEPMTFDTNPRYTSLCNLHPVLGAGEYVTDNIVTTRINGEHLVEIF